MLEAGIGSLGLSVTRGTGWTTDDPYRETQQLSLPSDEPLEVGRGFDAVTGTRHVSFASPFPGLFSIYATAGTPIELRL